MHCELLNIDLLCKENFNGIREGPAVLSTNELSIFRSGQLIIHTDVTYDHVYFSRGHMKCLGNGRLEITGQFQRHTDAFFRLVLSSQITADDVSDGYILSGDLELGDTKDSMQQSHFAVVKFEQQHDCSIHPMNEYLIKARSLLLFGCV